jgi:molybdopterin converting factor small subunit
MPKVQFTRHLKTHFPTLSEVEVEGGTVGQVVVALDQRYPGLKSYLTDDQGSLRRHVNIFVNEELIRDRTRLTDVVRPRDRLFVMQALSGG